MLLKSCVQTVLEVLDKSAQWLESRGVERARLDAELLMAEVLGCKRLDLYLQFDRPLAEEQLEPLREFIRRRGAREPLQYIVGHTPFMDLDLKTDRRALIPRPETEGLVEMVLNLYADTGAMPASVLDIGTGTGAVALSLAHSWPDADVTAVDVSAEALALARENAEACGLGGRVRFTESDLFENVGGAFDLVISNPPYLTTDEMDTAAPEVRGHEPELALVSGADGLDVIRRILAEAPGHLNPGGLLALETGIEQGEGMAAMASGFARHESREDFSGRTRYFLAWI